MKTIGVLGGLGPQATIDFEARVHRVAQRLIPQRGNEGYPPMVTYFFREPPVIMPADGSPPVGPPPINPHAAIAVLRARGVDGIILACTEFPLALSSALDEDIVNPADLLAEATVRAALA